MSKKKSSIEATIVEFFTTAEPAAKQTLFNVVQGLMKSSAPVVAAAVKPVRTRNANKSTGIVAQSVVSDTEQEAA